MDAARLAFAHMNPREAAYLALLASLRQDDFIIHYLEQWQQKSHPSGLDFAFALEIASGSARMALALDYVAAGLSSRNKLSLKLKERALLRTAIYQHCFMDKVPLYAVVDETMKLAKKYCHITFANYLNAMLRKLEGKKPVLPSGTTLHDLSIRYSYPEFYIKKLVEDYALPKAIEILEAGNQSPCIMARIRPGMNVEVLKDRAAIAEAAQSQQHYIQNATPVKLVAELAEKSAPPKRILDLCASPGGKLLAAHDLFPEAEVYANDISPEKVGRLEQNLSKYGVKAKVSCGLGETFSADTAFDLIILDVPCSNSGVLNKRAEARWRLTPEALQELKKKQNTLLEHALTLLDQHGIIWYITCSLLKDENERLIEAFCKRHGVECAHLRSVLPNAQGADGGFGSLLKKL